MSYQKQDFQSGQVLLASQLNAMDDQIAANEEKIGANAEAIRANAQKISKTLQIEDRLAILEDQMIDGALINDSGNAVSSNLWECTDFLDVSMFQNGSVTVNCSIYGTSALAMYDGNKEFVASINSDNITEYNGVSGRAQLQEIQFALPENVTYIRACAFIQYKEGGEIFVTGTRNITPVNLLAELKKSTNEIQDCIGSMDFLNLFNKNTCEIGKAIVSGENTVVSNSDLMVTDYIALKANTIYYANNVLLGGNYAFYDRSKNYLSSPDVTISTSSSYNNRKGCIITGSQEVYLRLTTYCSADRSYVSEFCDHYVEYGKKITMEEKIALSSKARLNGNLPLVLGDSISTDSYGNYKKWVTMLMEDGFLPPTTNNSSHHATGFVATYNGDTTLRFYDRMAAIENKGSYDFVVVFGGINDYIQGIPMGGESDTADPETYFKPAVDRFFRYLVEQFPNARICVLLPLRTYNIYKNTVGHYQQEYSSYIGEVAKSYCLPILNLTEESGFCPFLDSFKEKWTLVPEGYGPDGVHPTEEYSRRFLAPMIREFLKKL